MPKDELKCLHNEIKYQINSSLFFCSKCFSFFVLPEITNENISIIINHINNISLDSSPKILQSNDLFKANIFTNKKDYLKIRQRIIKTMKNIMNEYNLYYRTYFLALNYFDTICSKISKFNEDSIEFLIQMSKFCLILASKFSEHVIKTSNLEKELKKNLSLNYKSDEIYILKLLNYNLNVITSYDLLLEAINIGFVFNCENFNMKKFNIINSQIDKMLFAFSESKHFINFNSKIIVLSLILFIRECLDLNYKSEEIKIIYGEYNNKDLQNCLCKIRSCFKIKNNNNNKNNQKNLSN